MRNIVEFYQKDIGVIISKLKILVVEDEKILRVTIKDELVDNGYDVVTQENPVEALNIFKAGGIDIIVSDIRMPKMNGTELLKRAKEINPDVYVILMTAFATVESAVQCMQNGAYDYITKPFRTEELIMKLRKIEELYKVKKENFWLKSDIKKTYGIDSIVGNSPQGNNIKKLIETVAAKKTTVLITGETGTGKELHAGVLHYNSDRKNAPFLKVSCAVLAREVFESELFGHEKGSFTGADKQRPGRFELADDGTIYLDDIDDVPLDLQVKLLRVLQEQELERVGSSKTIKIDVRVIASTKVDLSKLVSEGRFREDLYYRLNIFPIHIPPLRERKEDIPLLINNFISVLSPGKKIEVTKEAMDILTSYHWPGNIRELKNITERLLILSDGGSIDKNLIPPELRTPLLKSERFEIGSKSFEDMIIDTEKEIISKAVLFSGGNMAKAAELLKLPSSTLRTKIYKYDIKP